MAENQELEEFKRKVATVSRRYAATHGMCEVVEQALEEMGLQVKKARKNVTLRLELDVVLDIDEAITDEDLAAYIKRHVEVPDPTRFFSRIEPKVGSGIELARRRSHNLRFSVAEVKDEPNDPRAGYQWRWKARSSVLHAVPNIPMVSGLYETLCERTMGYEHEWRIPGESSNPRDQCEPCRVRLAALGSV